MVAVPATLRPRIGGIMKCAYCEENILEGTAVQRIPPPEQLLAGHKSGALGLYPHPEHQGEEEDVLHPTCCSSYFDPEVNPYVQEQIIMDVRAEVEDEVREEIREEFREKFRTKNPTRYCVECWEELEESGLLQEPGEPMCPWCKTHDNVWERTVEDNTVYCCTQCGKYWDENEEELAA
jgi:hypothetical protein